MAATGVWFDFTGVQVAYTIGETLTTIVLDETLQVQVERSNSKEGWQPSGRRYDKLQVTSRSRRAITIQGGDVAKLANIPEDVACAVSGTLLDANNGTGVGALNITLDPCTISDGSFGSTAHNFAGVSATFEGYSPDGTDPMTITPVTS
jgi:hypothetical protein